MLDCVSWHHCDSCFHLFLGSGDCCVDVTGCFVDNAEVQMLVKANSKPHNIVIYTDGSVTRDRSGWGFTVKQGGKAVHKDSGAHRVMTSSLTMEVEAVTHAIQWLASQRDAQITHAIILTDSMNLLQKVES